MNSSSLIDYSLNLTEEIKENITPRIDSLIILRKLLDKKIKLKDAHRFGFVERQELIGNVMKINVDVYLQGANIIIPNTYVYHHVCQKCYNVADVPLPSPTDQSVNLYLCNFCGTCLVTDDERLQHDLGSVIQQ
jgi:hypothetical protein